MYLLDQGREIIEFLKAKNHDAFFVGGCVRDYLLKRNVNDIDIATSAKPDEVIKIFPRTVPTGIAHGTVLVLHNGKGFEVTTFRTESDYIDNRRPSKVKFINSIEEDLSRRDFTINAIAMDENLQIIDPFFGSKDIENKVIRTVGNPNERFKEDALRIMRALRFKGQLGFSIEENTMNSIEINAHLLKNIAVERILSEFEKLIDSDNSVDALEILIEKKISRYLPDLGLTSFKSNSDYLKLQTIEEKWTYFLIVNNIENSYETLRQWKLPKNKITKIQKLLKGYFEINNKSFSNKYLYDYGLDDSLKINRLQNVIKKIFIDPDKIVDKYNLLPIKSRSELSVNGNDLQAFVNIKKGIWIKELIEEIELLVINGLMNNNKLEIQEWVKTCKTQQYKN
jgi:tRNA nucleotidyltransferase (CCA-adding enzyme)